MREGRQRELSLADFPGLYVCMFEGNYIIFNVKVKGYEIFQKKRSKTEQNRKEKKQLVFREEIKFISQIMVVEQELCLRIIK